MIRPRAGDFRYSDAEKAAMFRDIATAEREGLAGLVIGAIDDRRRLDREFLSVALQGTTLPATLHRAFDTVSDPKTGVEDAIDLGFERILTSGQALKAGLGLDVLRDTVSSAAGRIAIMAGSGVTHDNVALILRDTQVDELHASCSVVGAPSPQNDAEMDLGFVPKSGTRATDASLVRALRDAIDTYQQPVV